MNNKKRITFVLKAIVSVSLLLVLIFNIDWNKVLISLQNANFYLIILASLSNVTERFELAYKWNLLIRVRGLIVKFGRIFWINSIGSFLGLFLPSSVGTDVVRGYYLVKNNDEKSVSISSVFVDRVLGMLSLLLFGTVSVFFAEDIVSQFNLKIYIVLFFILAIVSIYIFQKDWITEYIGKIQKLTKHKKIFSFLIDLHAAILEYKKFPKTLAFSFIVTLLVQVTRVFTYYIISKAFGINVPIVYFFLFVPLIMIAMMLPISIGGIGVREGTFVAFFSLAGMSIDDAVVISFMNSIVDMLNTLVLGGGGYMFYKPPPNKNNDLKLNTVRINE